MTTQRTTRTMAAVALLLVAGPACDGSMDRSPGTQDGGSAPSDTRATPGERDSDPPATGTDAARPDASTADIGTAEDAGAPLPDAPPPRDPVDPVVLASGTITTRSLSDRMNTCPLGNCKHVRVEYNPDDGLLYFMGGDYGGITPGYNESGRNEMWTYDIGADSWAQVQPYCRTDGSPQPSHPDEVGWTYDGNRHVFWMVPGYQWRPDADTCPGSTLVTHEIVWFDPVSGTWTIPAIDESFDAVGDNLNGNFGHAVFDPVQDTILAFKNGTPAVRAYAMATGEWTRHQSSANATSQMTNDVHPAVDYEGRRAYVPQGTTLHTFDMDGYTWSAETIPFTITAGEVSAVFDSTNRIVIVPEFHDDPGEQVRIHTYDPATGTWQEDVPYTAPAGVTVKGRHAVYHPEHNVTVLFGNVWGGAVPYLFLYRYDEG